MKNIFKIDFLWSFILSLLGFVFVVNYIFMASMDVPTTDYIRIINNYIDNVYDIKRFLVPDLIARVPINYLLRIINVQFFGFSMFFDRIVGALGLAFFNFLIINNLRKKIKINLLKNISSIVLTIVIFSLMSWEMLLNGTGCVIFIFFALTVLIYKLYEDIVYSKNNKLKCFIALLFFTCICCGSDYQVALLGTILFFSFVYLIFDIFEKNNSNKTKKVFDIKKETKFLLLNKFFITILVSFFILILYYISNHVGYAGSYTIVGMKDVSLKEVLTNYIGYVFNFIFKSLASIVIGVETFEYALTLESIKEYHIVLVGFGMGIIVLFTIILVLWKRLYKKYLMYVMIFFHGIASVGLVFLARYAFLNDHYGMSSRYAVQFMLVPVGIICLLSLYLDEVLYEKNIKLNNKKIGYIVAFSFMAFFLVYGRVITTLDELNKARARHFCYEQSYNLSQYLDDYPPSEENDKFLKNIFEYQRSADLIRQAFDILKQKKLNVYKK